MPWMKVPYPCTLNSTTGHCITAEADEVVHVPQVMVPEAMEKGWQPAEAPAGAPVEAPEQLSDNDTEEQKGSDEVALFQVELDQAVLRVLTRNYEGDFKSNGVPKMNAIVAEMSPDVNRPTAGQIEEAYSRLQENIDLADI